MPLKSWLGIDPGASGAIALVSRDEILAVPFKEMADWSGVRDLLDDWRCSFDIQLAALERVSSRPGQGVVSTFKFGANAGGWEAALIMARIPLILPTPQQWQKGLVLPSDGPDPKTRSLSVARRLFPTVDLHRKADNGKADALLLAEHARRYGQGR